MLLLPLVRLRHHMARAKHIEQLWDALQHAAKVMHSRQVYVCIYMHFWFNFLFEKWSKLLLLRVSLSGATDSAAIHPVIAKAKAIFVLSLWQRARAQLAVCLA